MSEPLALHELLDFLDELLEGAGRVVGGHEGDPRHHLLTGYNWNQGTKVKTTIMMKQTVMMMMRTMRMMMI